MILKSEIKEGAGKEKRKESKLSKRKWRQKWKEFEKEERGQDNKIKIKVILGKSSKIKSENKKIF
jgi:hypothetical protein